MFFPGQATPIFDLDDERLLFRLHDGPIEKGRNGAGALIRLALSTPRSSVFPYQGSRGISPSATLQTQGAISGLASIILVSACS